MRVEGNGFSKLTQVIRNTGYNKDIDIELATVTSPPPALKIKIDNMPIELEKDDLIVAEYLTKHKRTINLHSGEVFFSSTEIEGKPIPFPISEISCSDGSLTANNATVTFLDELKVGDRVIVASTNKGQLYVILDKVVMY